MTREDAASAPTQICHWRFLERVTCSDKTAYPTVDDAETGRTQDPIMRSYQCPWNPEHWHNGHPLRHQSRKRLRRALAARREEARR